MNRHKKFFAWAVTTVGLFVMTDVVQADSACIDQLATHLKTCRPVACDSADPRLEGRTLHVQIIGRRAGLCMASGTVAGRGGLDCAFTEASVRRLIDPATRQALASPDLRASVRAPQTGDDVIAVLHGHPLVSAEVHGRPLNTDFITNDCTLRLPDEIATTSPDAQK